MKSQYVYVLIAIICNYSYENSLREMATIYEPNEIIIKDISLEALNEHNKVRALHIDTPPLTLSRELSIMAQDYANYLAHNKLWFHSKNQYKSQWTGENLAKAWGNEMTGYSMTHQWYDEINDYDWVNGGSKNGGVVGHFTQVVWKNSKEVGFGIAQEHDGNKSWLGVANYFPGGNFNLQTDEKNMVKPLKNPNP